MEAIIKMNNIKCLRKKCNLSQEALGNKLNVCQQAIAKWEKGKTYPAANKLPELAKVLKCTIDDLLKVCDSDEKEGGQEEN